jgi:PBSX family phage portal protein
VCRVNSPLLLEASVQAAEYYEVQKALAEPAPSKGSRKLKQRIGVTIDGVQCASRPLDFSLFAYATTVNTYHARAVRAKAKDIVGRKWDLIADGKTAAVEQIRGFFKRAFGRLEFGEGMVCVSTDYESIGNGYLEVVPDGKGKPAELVHLPATEMWMRLDGLGYVQQKAGEYAHFRDFWLDRERYEGLKEDPLASADVTGVIHFCRYSSMSPYYGIPSILPAWPALVLMTLISEYNLTFFSNNAIPDYAVILEGEPDDKAEDVIRDYFRRHIKGQAHKTLVLSTPEGSKIRFEKLTDSNAREGSFRLLRSDCRDEICAAHGVPPQKVGIVETGKLGGNLASEQIEEYKNSIVTPGQQAVGARLTRLIEHGFGVEGVEFQFEEYDTEDQERNSRIDTAYVNADVLRRNEVRAKRFPDLPPLEDGDEPLHPATLADVAGVGEALGEIQQAVRKALAGKGAKS